jgi:putative ABC transport system permease protein
MKWFVPVLIAIRALRRNQLRTLLTMLGIIIGVAAVIATVSIGAGAKAQVQAQIDSLGRNVILIRAGSSARSGPQSGLGGAGTLTVEDAEAIRREIKEVLAVSPDQRSGGQIIAGNKNWYTTVLGEGPDYLSIRQWPLSRGAMFTDRDVRSLSKVLVLGKSVAKELFGQGDPVGQTVRIGDVPFQVIGELSSKGNSLMGEDQDDVAIVPYTSLMTRLQGTTSLRGLMAQASGPESVQQAQQRISALLRQRHRLRSGQDDDFMVLTQQEIAQTASETSRVMTIMLGAIASVSLLVGGIGIMNIMLVSVTERTREIGILLAVGARPRDVLLQFLIEAVTLSAAGGALGILIGIGSSRLLAAKMNWPTITSFSTILVAFLFSAAIGIFFGFFPAQKASRMDPIEALRYE